MIHLSWHFCRRINDNNNKNTVTLKFYIYSEDVYGRCLIVLVTSEVVEWKGKQRGSFFKEPQMGLLGGKCNKIWRHCPVSSGLRLVKEKQRKKRLFLALLAVSREFIIGSRGGRHQKSVLRKCNIEWGTMMFFLCFIYPTSVPSPIPSKCVQYVFVELVYIFFPPKF